jgi:acyl-coenzyme A synthetase/AMP-(fatty) acid ligase
VISPAIGKNWIRTSDLAMIDADGFLYHRGRADGAITRGGFSILPEVIETALLRHPDVMAAAVVGLPHRRLGEVPVAAIQPKDTKDPPDVAELEQHVRDHVYATHVPVQFRFVSTLPVNPSMKVDLPKVRALFDREPPR